MEKIKIAVFPYDPTHSLLGPIEKCTRRIPRNLITLEYLRGPKDYINADILVMNISHMEKEGEIDYVTYSVKEEGFNGSVVRYSTQRRDRWPVKNLTDIFSHICCLIMQKTSFTIDLGEYHITISDTDNRCSCNKKNVFFDEGCPVHDPFWIKPSDKQNFSIYFSSPVFHDILYSISEINVKIYVSEIDINSKFDIIFTDVSNLKNVESYKDLVKLWKPIMNEGGVIRGYGDEDTPSEIRDLIPEFCSSKDKTQITNTTLKIISDVAKKRMCEKDRAWYPKEFFDEYKLCERNISHFYVYVPFDVFQDIIKYTDEIEEVNVVCFYHISEKLKGKIDLCFAEECSEKDILEFKEKDNLAPEGEICYIINKRNEVIPASATFSVENDEFSIINFILERIEEKFSARCKTSGNLIPKFDLSKYYILKKEDRKDKMDFVISYPNENIPLVNHLEGIEEVNIKVTRNSISEKLVDKIDLLFINSDDFVDKYYIEQYTESIKRYMNSNGTICYFGDSNNMYKMEPYIPDSFESVVNKSLVCLCKKYNSNKDLSWNGLYHKYCIPPKPEKREVPEFNVYVPWWVVDNISTFEGVKEISINLITNLSGCTQYDLALIDVNELKEYGYSSTYQYLSKVMNPNGGMICYVGDPDTNHKIVNIIPLDYDKITNKVVFEASLKYHRLTDEGISSFDKYYMIPKQKVSHPSQEMYIPDKNDRKIQLKVFMSHWYLYGYLEGLKKYLENIEEVDIKVVSLRENLEKGDIDIAFVDIASFHNIKENAENYYQKYLSPGGKIWYIGEENLEGVRPFLPFDNLYKRIVNIVLGKAIDIGISSVRDFNATILNKYFMTIFEKEKKSQKEKFVIYIDSHLKTKTRESVQNLLEKVEEFEVIIVDELKEYEGKKINVAFIDMSRFDTPQQSIEFMHKNIDVVDEETGKWCIVSSKPLKGQSTIFSGVKDIVSYALGVMERKSDLNIFTLSDKYNFFSKECEKKDIPKFVISAPCSHSRKLGDYLSQIEEVSITMMRRPGVTPLESWNKNDLVFIDVSNIKSEDEFDKITEGYEEDMKPDGVICPFGENKLVDIEAFGVFKLCRTPNELINFAVEDIWEQTKRENGGVELFPLGKYKIKKEQQPLYIKDETSKPKFHISIPKSYKHSKNLFEYLRNIPEVEISAYIPPSEFPVSDFSDKCNLIFFDMSIFKKSEEYYGRLNYLRRFLLPNGILCPIGKDNIFGSRGASLTGLKEIVNYTIEIIHLATRDRRHPEKELFPLEKYQIDKDEDIFKEKLKFVIYFPDNKMIAKNTFENIDEVEIVISHSLFDENYKNFDLMFFPLSNIRDGLHSSDIDEIYIDWRNREGKRMYFGEYEHLERTKGLISSEHFLLKNWRILFNYTLDMIEEKVKRETQIEEFNLNKHRVIPPIEISKEEYEKYFM